MGALPAQVTAVTLPDRIIVSIWLDEMRSGVSWLSIFNEIAADTNANVAASGGPRDAVLILRLGRVMTAEDQSSTLDEVMRIVEKTDREFDTTRRAASFQVDPWWVG
jgi:hypothetical protein